MLRPTGPGVVKVDPKETTASAIGALLANYDIDGSSLKREHEEFLRSRVLKLLADNKGHIWLRGRASRSGTDQHNLDLSKLRVRGVAEFLARNGVLPAQMQLDAVGERMSLGGSQEEALDRSVALLVQPRTREAPPPREPPEPPLEVDQFKLRILGPVAAGKVVSPGAVAQWTARLAKHKAGVVVDIAIVEIRDRLSKLSAFYLFSGIGGGITPYFPSPTYEGPWNFFHTSRPIHVSQFAGAARFHTLQVGVNIVDMFGTPDGVEPVHKVIDVGRPLGGSGTFTAGDLVLGEVRPAPGL